MLRNMIENQRVCNNSQKRRRVIKNTSESIRDNDDDKPMLKNMQNDPPPPPPPFLPHDIVVENILNRLTVKTLIRCSSVSNLWYNSIHHDPHFASSHSLFQTKNNSRLIIVVTNIHMAPGDKALHRLYCLSRPSKDDGDGAADLLYLRRFGRIESTYKRELVGRYNGLVCFSQMGPRPGVVDIYNHSMDELLYIFLPIFDGHSVCYGFGFDSLTKEYKVVLILGNFKEEYKCLIFTLGTNSWRETKIPPPSPNQTFRWRPKSRSAIFCDGALFWRTSSTAEPNNEKILVSFNLHDEMFQVIQLPTKCVPPQKKYLVHLLQYKGSLCVARIEKKILLRSIDEDHDSSSSNRNYEVHLYLLKDKVENLWSEETFDVLSVPNLYDAIYGPRILSFSDRVLLLFWIDRWGSLQFYDLQRKHLKVVEPPVYEHHVFRKKNPLDNNLFHHLEYHPISSYVENFLSLRTFLPEGARNVEARAMEAILKQKPKTLGGYLSAGRPKSRTYYAF